MDAKVRDLEERLLIRERFMDYATEQAKACKQYFLEQELPDPDPERLKRLRDRAKEMTQKLLD